MFDSLDRIFTALVGLALVVLAGMAIWQFGLLPVLLVAAVVALLTWKRLWLAAILGAIIGLS